MAPDLCRPTHPGLKQGLSSVRAVRIPWRARRPDTRGPQSCDSVRAGPKHLCFCQVSRSCWCSWDLTLRTTSLMLLFLPKLPKMLIHSWGTDLQQPDRRPPPGGSGLNRGDKLGGIRKSTLLVPRPGERGILSRGQESAW